MLFVLVAVVDNDKIGVDDVWLVVLMVGECVICCYVHVLKLTLIILKSLFEC